MSRESWGRKTTLRDIDKRKWLDRIYVTFVTLDGDQVVPVIGGLEAAAALYAGHMPGVFVGAATVLW